MKKNIQAIVSAAHLFSLKLDWLHFGFGTLAIGRENVSKVLGAQMAVSFRGFDHYVYPLKHKDCYRLTFQKGKRFHVLSEGMAKALISNGVAEPDIEVIPPAIDIDQFDSLPDTPRSSDRLLQLVTVARLHWIKGLEYTLEALALLKKEGINFRYTIIGEGDERERLIFAVHQLNLKEQVVFAGRQSQSEIVAICQKADIYIQYSIQEGFCNAVLEAQAMGLWCVVSDAEGLTENVINNETGWVVPKRQPGLLAHKLIEITLLKGERVEEVRKNVRRRVRNDFSLQLQKERFLHFYRL